MSGIFWGCVVLGYVAGGWTSFVLARFAVGRVSDDSSRAARVRQAGITAGAVASLPALFFATVLGGTLGGAVADGIGMRFALGEFARHILGGVGVGLGVFSVMLITIVATAIAGAVFMKVYLAR
jgi:hypothetical protein